jgi:hypothetical protein
MGAAMEAALAHQTASRPEEAANLYRQTLALAPNTHDALHMLGVIELGCGNLQLAEELILGALKLRPPYEAIESNIRLLRESQINEARATEDQLCERALPIFNDLIFAPPMSPQARASAAGSGELHLIGRIHGEDEDDVWMLHRLNDVLAPLSPRVWAADNAGPVPRRLGTASVIDARSGQHPRGGTQIFVGVDYDLEAWIDHSRADRVVVVCGRGRPSRYLAQLRTLAMNGARRIELAFVSRARAERFGPGHALIPLPVESVTAPIALASQPREAGVWSISEPRPWSIGMVGQVNGSVVEPTDSKLIAEIATHANAIAIYDPGRYRFLLGATASIRFVSRSNGGLTPFVASVDCLYCRPQQWWDEGAGREVLIAMALGKPVICPRRSMHAWLIEHRVDGLLYETRTEALGLLHALHRAPLWAAKLGEAARSKAQDLIDTAKLEGSYQSITPAARISADKERRDH